MLAPEPVDLVNVVVVNRYSTLREKTLTPGLPLAEVAGHALSRRVGGDWVGSKDATAHLVINPGILINANSLLQALNGRGHLSGLLIRSDLASSPSEGCEVASPESHEQFHLISCELQSPFPESQPHLNASSHVYTSSNRLHWVYHRLE